MKLFSPLRSIRVTPDELALEAHDHLERAGVHEQYEEHAAMTAQATVARAKVALADYLRTHAT
ncbi:hypothetical protein ACFU99_35995 [Streptomyces sp. NPDC057654]|uniref:hypothetical protein n=1 Tax=Streptomyces sp. NPDC057654 TaxID=3346196 RepID=UPI00367ED375